MEFDNLHQVLANLYQDMLPLCGDIIGVAKGLAGLGAMFYVANRVWQALSRAEPIDCIPFTSSVCHWIMYSFFSNYRAGNHQYRNESGRKKHPYHSGITNA